MEKTAQSKGKIRIYIADKTEDNQLVSYIRENEKFSLVGSSTNGEDVLESVPLLKPDFLVMEVMLSGIDGFVVLEKLKESMGENMPKVIFVTNLSHTGFVTKAMNEGASYFMVKPVKPEVLAERIFDLMQSSSQQVSTMKVNKQHIHARSSSYSARRCTSCFRRATSSSTFQ